jgi:hypothetical protein
MGAVRGVRTVRTRSVCGLGIEWDCDCVGQSVIHRDPNPRGWANVFHGSVVSFRRQHPCPCPLHGRHVFFENCPHVVVVRLKREGKRKMELPCTLTTFCQGRRPMCMTSLKSLSPRRNTFTRKHVHGDQLGRHSSDKTEQGPFANQVGDAAIVRRELEHVTDLLQVGWVSKTNNPGG